jgi:hypothetical protein
MKEKIYTIPVNDAFNKTCECPLCEMEAKTTSDLLTYYMGASLMESDVRILTNEKGFCKAHLSAMYNLQSNRLGLGLMLQTHLADLCRDLNGRLVKSIPSKDGGFITRAKENYKKNLNQMADEIAKRVSSCVLCDRLAYTMDRYMDVILWQYFEDPDFRDRFEQTPGFCLPHVAMLLRGAAKYLSRKEASIFMTSLCEAQNRSMDTLRDELLWFTKKFDYKNEKEPWGNSHDAVPRSIRKIVGDLGLNQ